MDNHLLNLFTNESGEFARGLRFDVVILMVVIVLFLTFYFRKTYAFVIILIVFIIYIANTFIGFRTQKVTDFNKITLYKLQKIQDNVNSAIRLKIEQSNKMGLRLPKKDENRLYRENKIDSFYVDANMIYFIDSISPLYDYNKDEYFTFVKGVNNILRIRREIEDYYSANNDFPININEMLESAIALKANTINNLHTFIYTVPKENKMYRYIDKIIERYNLLITRNIDIIHEYYKKNIEMKGINTTTKFIYPDATKPYDSTKNHTITPIKNGNRGHPHPETLPFYI